MICQRRQNPEDDDQTLACELTDSDDYIEQHDLDFEGDCVVL